MVRTVQVVQNALQWVQRLERFERPDLLELRIAGFFARNIPILFRWIQRLERFERLELFEHRIGSLQCYTARNAWVIFNRAARTAGKKPPMRPISNEKPRALAAIDGDSAKENASSENEPKFSVDMVKN